MENENYCARLSDTELTHISNGWVEALRPTTKDRHISQIFRIEGANVLHRGKVSEFDDLIKTSKSLIYEKDVRKLIGPKYTIYFKKDGVAMQYKFYLKTRDYVLENSKGYDVDTGEVAILKNYKADYGLTVEMISGVLTNHENNKIRGFQKRNAR